MSNSCISHWKFILKNYPQIKIRSWKNMKPAFMYPFKTQCDFLFTVICRRPKITLLLGPLHNSVKMLTFRWKISEHWINIISTHTIMYYIFVCSMGSLIFCIFRRFYRYILKDLNKRLWTTRALLYYSLNCRAEGFVVLVEMHFKSVCM